MIDKEKIENAVKMILEAIGEDVNREGLRETPKRVAKAYEEIFSGIGEDPGKYLKIFPEKSKEDEIVVINDIPLYSMCEHHLLPFFGKIHIAYLPNNGKILGLSKFVRIIECFAKRPQVQERLTSSIADFIFDELQPQGVAVMIDAEHLCMTMRGVSSIGSKTYTSSFRGVLKTDEKYRQEAIELLNCKR